MIIDGKQVASKIIKEIKDKISSLQTKPSISVILVGNNLASQTYVKMKKKACENTDINFKLINLDDKISQEDLIKKIKSLNEDKTVDSILIQMPLPKHIDPTKVINSIDPSKDVDGFHPVNVGKLLIGDETGFVSCTPLGIKSLLEESNIDIKGKHVVIVGRSNIVGKPLFALLIQKAKGANATVTVVHSETKNLKEITKTADILVAAIGIAKFIKKDMIKKNAVVIDVGINHEVQKDGTKKIFGDVDFENVSKIASFITPVPGGVGPMTIAMLLSNILKSHIQKK